MESELTNDIQFSSQSSNLSTGNLEIGEELDLEEPMSEVLITSQDSILEIDDISRVGKSQHGKSCEYFVKILFKN